MKYNHKISYNSWGIVRRPIFSLPFWHFTMWHYGLLTPLISNEHQVVVNYGPTFPILNPSARLTFEKYDSQYWEETTKIYDMYVYERLPDEEITARSEYILNHIAGYDCVEKIPNIKLDGEIYHLMENNCEHFCTEILYGHRFSTQADDF